MTDTDETCIWCPGCPRIPAAEFDAHLNRTHPELSDPARSDSCWSRAEITTPDGLIHDIACARGRHRWGKHRNRHVKWPCPPRCTCIRHPRKDTP